MGSSKTAVEELKSKIIARKAPSVHVRKLGLRQCGASIVTSVLRPKFAYPLAFAKVPAAEAEAAESGYGNMLRSSMSVAKGFPWNVMAGSTEYEGLGASRLTTEVTKTRLRTIVCSRLWRLAGPHRKTTRRGRCSMLPSGPAVVWCVYTGEYAACALVTCVCCGRWTLLLRRLLIWYTSYGRWATPPRWAGGVNHAELDAIFYDAVLCLVGDDEDERYDGRRNIRLSAVAPFFWCPKPKPRKPALCAVRT